MPIFYCYREITVCAIEPKSSCYDWLHCAQWETRKITLGYTGHNLTFSISGKKHQHNPGLVAFMNKTQPRKTPTFIVTPPWNQKPETDRILDSWCYKCEMLTPDSGLLPQKHCGFHCFYWHVPAYYMEGFRFFLLLSCTSWRPCCI